MSPFIVIPFFRKIGFKEMNVKKFRNFVITEFVKSGFNCTCTIGCMRVFFSAVQRTESKSKLWNQKD